MSAATNEIAVVMTSPNESLERTVNLTDREALKKLKKRVTNILNDAIDGASKGTPASILESSPAAADKS